MTFNIKQDGTDHSGSPTFEQAVTAIQTLLRLHPKTLSATTFSIEDENGKLLALVSNRRITGVFTKQTWGGRKGNDALHAGTEEFDATDFVFLMSYDDLQTLQDNSETTDWVGSEHIEWDGPHEVVLTESICDYFGVSAIEDITEEALAFARKASGVVAPREETLTLSVNLSVFVTRGGNVDDFIRDMYLKLASQTPGVKVGLVGIPSVARAA
jgi:hypothetical protein